MEYNREESIRCFEIANEWLAKGDEGRALKFAQKSEKLYPSTQAKDLLQKIDRLGRNHSASHQNTRGSSQSDNFTKFTQDQVDAVNRIKRCKNYYEILGVTKDFTDNEVKKKYRKLALQFHPDKNHAPGAAEAFKAISNAFAVLSDAEKKRGYDLAGTKDRSNERRSSNAQWDYTYGFESEMSADEIFNMFFGGSEFTNGGAPKSYANGATAHTFRRHRQVNNQDRTQLLLQLSPVLLLVILSMASFAFVEEQRYSFIQTAKYSDKMISETLKVVYFVMPNFSNEHTNQVAKRIDMEVETAYVSDLKDGCRTETLKKERLSADDEEPDMRQCEELERLQKIYT